MKRYLLSNCEVCFMLSIHNSCDYITCDKKKTKLTIYNHKISKQYSTEGGKKWNIGRNIPMFSEIGVIPQMNNILIGIEDNNYYIVYLGNNTLISSIEKYQTYSSDSFIWLKCEDTNKFLDDKAINKSGYYLVHLPTNIYCQVRNPPSQESEEVFKTENRTIKWDGNNFKYINNSDDEIVDESIISEKDVRKEEFEDLIENNVELDIPNNTEYIDKIDRCSTPKPMAYIFYELADGDFSENNDGEFDPPKQDEYAEYAFEYFKEHSENNQYFDEKYRSSWMQRLKNTWASLMRDVHFSLMMFKEQTESEPFDDVDFDVEKDVNDGVDFIVNNEEQEYHINLFVDTSKSRNFLDKKKDHRHPEKRDVTELEVPLKIDGKKKEIQTSGDRDMWLFSEDHIEAVNEVIQGDRSVVLDQNGNVLCQKI